MNPQQKLSAAILYAENVMPYMATGLSSLVRRPAPGLGTMATSKGMVMMYDPEFVEQHEVPELAGVVMHELWHCLRDHFGRCDSCAADPVLFNIAGDEEINDDLISVKLKNGQLAFPLPKPVLPKDYGHADGKIAEEYYKLLRQQQQSAGDGKGDGKGKGKGRGNLAGPDKPQGGSGWCGSAGGRPVPGEPEANDKAQRGQSDIDRIKLDVADAVRKHSESHGRGSVPAGLDRWAKELFKPAKVRWQDKLRRAARSCCAYAAGCVDYTYRRASRKQQAIDAIADGRGMNSPLMPGMHRPIVRAAIGIDTSGSMGDEELLRAVSESAGVIKAIGSPVMFLSCDADVHGGVVQVRSAQELSKRMKGGGGTDFRPAFEAVMRLRPRPDVFIYITDGMGPAPETQPDGLGVIWVLVGASKTKPTKGDSGKPVDWGIFVQVDEDETN